LGTAAIDQEKLKYRLSSLNFPPLFPAKIAGKRGGKLSEERR